jgi:hypothetical protein
MAERRWFPQGADQEELGGILLGCDDPPTTALALEAAPQLMWRALREEAERREH